MTIRSMKPTDVKRVVDVHLQCFEGFFLSFLGPKFLKELYLAILSDPSGIAYVAEDSETILGFVAGTEQPAGFYRHLIRKRWYRFGLTAVIPTIRAPSIIPRLLRAFQKPREVEQPNCGLLMSIAVLPGQQSKGIGKALVSAFVNEAIRRGNDAILLTTDMDNNEKTNAFYQQMDFQIIRTFSTPEGRRMNEYKLELVRDVKE